MSTTHEHAHTTPLTRRSQNVNPGALRVEQRRLLLPRVRRQAAVHDRAAVRTVRLNFGAQRVHPAPREGDHAVAALHLGQAGEGAAGGHERREALVPPDLEAVACGEVGGRGRTDAGVAAQVCTANHLWGGS